jgi:hypothetical protein
MDTGHIRNCIKMLKRRWNEYLNEHVHMMDYGDGDHDWSPMSLMLAFVDIEHAFPVIKELRAELAKRKAAEVAA